MGRRLRFAHNILLLPAAESSLGAYIWTLPMQLASLVGMQHLSEQPPVVSPEVVSVALRAVEPSLSSRIAAFVSALRAELEESDMELLSADLRHVADAGPSWYLTIRRTLGSLEVLRAKVSNGAPLDDSTRDELRDRIMAHFAR